MGRAPTITVYRVVKNNSQPNRQAWDSGIVLTPSEIKGGWWTGAISFSDTVFPEYTYYWRLYSWQSWRGLFINTRTEDFWSYEFDGNGNYNLSFGYWPASTTFTTYYSINVPGYDNETWEWRFDIVNLVGKPYDISFNINGGSGTIPGSITSRYDNVIYFPYSNAFSRTGYTFNGWELYGGNDYIQTYNAGDGYSWKEPYALTNHVAKAKWSAITYKIYYSANGGTGTVPGYTDATYGSDVTLTANPFTKVGYTFSGWGTSTIATSSSYSNSQTFSYNIADALRLYAFWVANTYYINYNRNTGTGNAPTQTTAVYNSSVTLTANPFTKTGYNFNGWGISDTATSSSYANSEIFSYNIADSIILYARWSIIQYTVTFSSTIDTKTTIREVTENYGSSVTFPIFKAVGYNFLRWVNGSITYVSISSISAPITLNAVWEKKENINFSELNRVYNGTRGSDPPLGIGAKSISIGKFRTESEQITPNQIKLITHFKGKQTKG